MPRRVVVAGYFGHANFGDDVFVWAIECAAETRWANPALAVIGHARGHYYADGRLGVSSPPFSNVSGNSALLRGVRTVTTVRRALWADWVLFAGGSVFGEEMFRTRDTLIRVAGARRVPVAAIGVSVGPFRSALARRRVSGLVKALDLLAVRDKASLIEVESLGVEPRRLLRGADLAFSIPVQAYGPSDNGVLGLSLCAGGGHAANAESMERDQSSLMSACIDVCRSRGMVLRLLVLNTGDRANDRRISMAAMERARAAGVRTEWVEHVARRPELMWQSIATCSAVVSVRLHGGIAACAQGRPFLSYPYHPKVTDFLAEFKDLGMPQLRVGQGRAEMAEAIDALVSTPDEYLRDCGELRGRADSMLEAARLASAV